MEIMEVIEIFLFFVNVALSLYMYFVTCTRMLSLASSYLGLFMNHEIRSRRKSK